MTRYRTYSIKVVTDVILFTGHKRIILKSNGESSITALKNAVKGASDLNLGVEVSPVGDSKANGEIERAVRTVQGQARTLKSALDMNYKTEFGENHAIMPWLVACASSLISKFTLGIDGKTSHERCRGRKFDKVLPEFGECVMYLKTPQHKGREKLEPRWESGVYLGVHDRSQELIIGTPDGAIKAHEFRRKGSHEERWNMEEITVMKGLPWQPDPNTASLEVQSRIIVAMSLPDPGEREVDTRLIIARGIAVKRSEYMQMGPTP